MTHTRAQIPIPVLLSCTCSRGPHVAQTLPFDPAWLRVVRPPCFCRTGAAPRDAPKAAVSAANNADVLTPDQAKRALDTLQDDKKRAQIIDTLRAIAKASPQAQAAPPAPEPNSAIPLTADSLGAQLLLTVSEQVGEISHEIADMARTLTHFTAFYYWIVQTANDPSAYDQLLDIAWKLALVFGCAFAAEWVIVPRHQAAGRAAGSTPAANGACPVADAGRSSIRRPRRRM